MVLPFLAEQQAHLAVGGGGPGGAYSFRIAQTCTDFICICLNYEEQYEIVEEMWLCVHGSLKLVEEPFCIT